MTLPNGLSFLWNIRDGRTWIILFFLVRLFHITQPPLEVVHNWRQCTVVMVARNFQEVDNNILYPRLDIGGDGTGIEGMEFPLLNYTIYIVSEIAGYDHWYGRLINLLVSSIGVWYFFLLTRRWNDRMALYAVIILECSLWFVYMRKIMPDTFSVALVLTGIYHAVRYLADEKGGLHLLFYTIFSGLGVLAKLPAACLLPVLLIPFIHAGRIRMIFFSSASVVVIGAAACWYFYWVPYLNETYGTGHFFMGRGLATGAREIAAGWPLLLALFYDHTLKFIGFIVFIAGLFYALYKRERVLMGIFALSLSALMLILVKGGAAVLHHDYYMIPFAPVMALLAAYALNHIPNRWLALTLVLGIGLEGLLNQVHDFRIKDGDRPVLGLEQVMDRVVPVGKLVAINSGRYPTPMYFAHRKGWVLANGELANTALVEDLRSRGLEYIVVMKKMYERDLVLPYHTRYEDDDLRIYQLDL